MNAAKKATSGNSKDTALQSLLTTRRRVYEWIEDEIVSGRIPYGTAIPSERVLATELSASRGTVAAAIADAERDGLLVRRVPTARKRFAAFPHKRKQPVRDSSVIVIMAAQDPFRNGEPDAPRWSDRFLSFLLLSRFSDAGRHVMMVSHKAIETSGIEQIFQPMPAGMVVTSTIDSDPYARLVLDRCRKCGVPVVAYGNGPDLERFDRVYTDHRAGSRDITKWLVRQGCRKIVPFFNCPLPTHWAAQRLEGYADAMRAAKLKAYECVYAVENGTGMPDPIDNFSVNRAVAVERLLELRRKLKFDALICISDYWAKIAIAALRVLGLEPNRDVLVAGYDNIESHSAIDAFEPGRAIVTIDKHNEKTVDSLAGLLLDRLAGILPSEPQVRVHPQELVVRNDAVI